MAKARRAQPRPARIVVPIIVVVVALAVVAVGWRMRSDDTASPNVTAPSASAGQTDGSPSVAGSPAPSDTPSGTPSAAGPATTSAAAAKALQDCRAKVGAGDDVLKAASTGVGHWSEHVQAQSDEFDDKISDDTMSKIFTRTRLAGPDDVSRYDDATKAWDDADGTCASRDDASTADNTQLGFCGQRLGAMKPAMTAADDGMGDWENHLAAMRRSRMIHVDNAEQIWLDAWKAAPPHIQAFDKAMTTYADAPDC
jgi:hypothetical protein